MEIPTEIIWLILFRHILVCILFARRILRMQEIETTRNQASIRRIQSVKNLARAQQCRTEVNENHPEEEIDLEPLRKIETRSQVRSSSPDNLLLRG